MDSICCGMRIPKGKTGRGGGLQASLTPIVLLAVALSRPGLLEDRQDGSQHAKGIQVQRAVGDVVVLQVQPLVVLDVRASIAGPPAREAGLHLVVQRRPPCSSSSPGMRGRGPMMDMSPATTLKNWGSSSSDVWRRMWPTGVMRGSLSNFWLRCHSSHRFGSCSSSASTSSAFHTMERSFQSWKGLPRRPMRVCL